MQHSAFVLWSGRLFWRYSTLGQSLKVHSEWCGSTFYRVDTLPATQPTVSNYHHYYHYHYHYNYYNNDKKVQQSWQTSALAMHLPLARLVSMPVIFCLLPSSSIVTFAAESIMHSSANSRTVFSESQKANPLDAHPKHILTQNEHSRSSVSVSLKSD